MKKIINVYSCRLTSIIIIISLYFLNTVVSAESLLSGTLQSDTTLTAEAGPWRITGDVIVPDGVTLTIEDGTTVYFDNQTELTIGLNGRLLANGSESGRILFTRTPESDGQWDGIRFNNTLQDNRLCFVDMKYGDRFGEMINIQHSRLLIDNMTWNTSNKTVLEVNHPRLHVRNSVFPNVESVEVIHGQSLAGDEYFILDGNTFGSTTGYNDVIDFSDCKRPGPILQAYNNTFLGGGDDGLDLDGCDAHIEGNIFTNFHRADSNPGTSSAVATGYRFDRTSDITVVRNIFYNNDHSVLLKEDCYMLAENNVFVNNNIAVINYSEWPLRNVSPGKGADLNGNIFFNNALTFENQLAQPGFSNPVISVNRCIIPGDLHGLGSGNIDADPQFIDPDGDFHLRPGSPAIGAGPNGLDMGRYVPAGASISGEPDSVTTDTTVTLTIGGPGIIRYKYVINDTSGAWSDEFTITDNPVIQLNGLENGKSYTVYVKGRNSAGTWQSQPEYASSKTWTVELDNTGIRQKNSFQSPAQFRLYQNSPNPFNPSTNIKFDLPEPGFITLMVYNLKGKKVTTLISGKYNQGSYTINWNAAGLSSGLYYVVLQAGNLTERKKMILLK
ncbi:T9SS type A sorting domain-containing protein [candidate division KSB1 bacterium]|nr:T9SS type A sorting domain-containing protein [candidate division KSB1 bacterium]